MNDWAHVFDEAYPCPGASEAALAQLVANVGQPLSPDEIAAINAQQRNPFPVNDPLYASYRPFDPSAWIIPNRPLPPAYLAFLRWSDGGEFRTGERWLGFFPATEVRELLLAYCVPQYMPGVLPFALDGGGIFYVFDMRQPPTGGEYPVLITAAGNLGYDDARLLATSFLEACRDTTEPGRLLHGQ